ncbi:MAG TPA: EAL domain-containing protein [Methylibium sp.]|uniref:bifunctional diguanylate cyclase/phosphodiesterase n=1 Tax=Methylibium sp. TaxID=2067992 RepID=UPI002DBE3E88|nr:EAL domain-containing protein [Methylibium sp.]HEU4457889.1 EAL domain-containing protein [Methylibium sp.]
MDAESFRADDPAALQRLALRCARQVSFSWTQHDDRLQFGEEAQEFLAPGLLRDVRTGAELIARVEPADRAALRASIIATLKGRTRDGARGPGLHEALMRLRSDPRDGEARWHWIALRGDVTAWDEHGRSTRISGVLFDETERESERREALRTRDLYAMQGAVNRTIANSAERATLLNALCEVAVLHGGFALAWVALADDVRAHAIRVGARAGTPADYPDRVCATYRTWRQPGDGLIGRVLREGRLITLDDLRDDHARSGRFGLALGAQLLSIGCFPLFERGAPIGVLMVYAREAGCFDPAMCSLLQGMGSDVSKALDHLAIRREQAETQRQFDEAHRQFRTAMAASLDGMLIVEADGRVVEANPAAHALLGWRGAAAPTAPHLLDDGTPERLRAERVAQMQAAAAAGTGTGPPPLRRIESWARRRDGAELPVELVFTPLERGRLMVMVRDLTTLHRQRQELIDAAGRYERLVEHSPEGMLVHTDGVIVLVNRKLRSMIGAEDANALIGLDCEELMHPDDLAAHKQRLASLRTREGANREVTAEVRLRHADGSWVECELVASTTEFHGIAARQVVLRDIGERKRFERLQASQQTVLSMIAGREPLSAVLLQVAGAIERNAPEVQCCVYVADEAGETFVAAFSPSVPTEALETDDIRRISADSPSVMARAAFERMPAVIEDVALDATTPAVRAVRDQLGARSVGAWPLLSRTGQLMGVIYLAMPRTGPPSPHVLQMVHEYSDLTAVAIDNDRQAARIRHLAQHDTLTGLPNRAMFKELLGHAIARTERNGGMLATLFVDLDRFKIINDTFGHGVGDAVLCETAQRLQQAVRGCDRVARMGGDEFFVLVDEIASAEAAAAIAQRILQGLALPMNVDDQEHVLSASIGIAVYPRDGDSSDSLLKHADIAMYRAKQQGRNGYGFFAEADNIHTAERFALQALLRRALARREFVLHYQPKVDVRSGKVHGVEALVRWHHPQLGMVMPGDFIGVAEDSGLIVPLGRQVMEMAFEASGRFAEACGRRITVAINLSAMQIASKGLTDEVQALLERSGADPEAIQFEITESALIRQPEQARGVIEALRRMGLQFALDDFGTGYSSLTYLKRFPVQCVKIDRSFVKDIPGDASDLAITRAIVAMAHSLGLGVVAEGVETPEQLQALQQMGCDEYQGYYFSKPVEIERAIALMGAPAAARSAA